MESSSLRADINSLVNGLIRSGIVKADGIHPNVDTLLSSMNKLISASDNRKVNEVGMMICNVLDNVTFTCLKNDYLEAVVANNEHMAQTCHNKLMFFMKENQRLKRLFRHADVATRPDKAPSSSFKYAESLLNGSVLPQNKTAASASDDFRRSKISKMWPVASRLINEMSVIGQPNVSTYPTGHENQSDFQNIRPERILSNLNSETVNNLPKTSYNRVKQDGNDKLTTDIKKHRTESQNTRISSQLKNSINSEQLYQKKIRLSNDRNVKPANAVNKTSYNCVTNSKHNKNKRSSDKISSSKVMKADSFTTPVRQVSKLPKSIVSTLEIMKNKRIQRNSKRDESDQLDSTLRPRRKRPRICKTTQDYSEKRKLKNNITNSDKIKIKKTTCTTVDSSQNISTDYSAYTHASTPTSTMSHRIGKKMIVFRKRTLF